MNTACYRSLELSRHVVSVDKKGPNRSMTEKKDAMYTAEQLIIFKSTTMFTGKLKLEVIKCHIISKGINLKSSFNGFLFDEV